MKFIKKLCVLFVASLMVLNFSVSEIQAATLKLNYTNTKIKKDQIIVLKLSGTSTTSKVSGANSSVSVSKHYKQKTVTKTKKVIGKKVKVKVKQWKTVKEKYKTKVKQVVKNQYDIKGLKEGQATINVTANKKTLKCNITVYETTIQKLNFSKESNTSINLFGNIRKNIAHRGYQGDDSPENTTSAFIKAGQSNDFCGIETDVQRTKDGKLVVFHDDDLKRLTSYVVEDEEGLKESEETVSALLRHKTLEEQQVLCIKGHIDLKIPSFEEYLDI